MDYELALELLGEYAAMSASELSPKCGATCAELLPEDTPPTVSTESYRVNFHPSLNPNCSTPNEAMAIKATEVRIAHQLGFAIANGDLLNVQIVWLGESSLHGEPTLKASMDRPPLSWGRRIAMAAIHWVTTNSPTPSLEVAFRPEQFSRELRAHVRRIIESSDAVQLEMDRTGELIADNLVAALATKYDLTEVPEEERDSVRFGVNELRDLRISIQECLDLLSDKSNMPSGNEAYLGPCFAALSFAYEVAAVATDVMIHSKLPWLDLPGIAVCRAHFVNYSPDNTPRSVDPRIPVPPPTRRGTESFGGTPLTPQPVDITDACESYMTQVPQLGLVDSRAIRKHGPNDVTPEEQRVIDRFS